LPSSTRRNFLRAGALAAGGALAVGADAFAWEPNHPHLVKIEIALRRLPEAWDGFRIAQLSDFHYDEYFSIVPLRRAIGMVNDLKPDMVALTGDFVTAPAWGSSEADAVRAAKTVEPCAALLAQIHSRLGSFAVLGNHDDGSDGDIVKDGLKSHGITVLRNGALPLTQSGARLWLAGIDDALQGQPDLDLALRSVPHEEPVLLMAHEPDFALQTKQYPVDLQLSGHSHGGQVRLPLIGAPWLPPLGRKFPRGLYKLGNLTLYTNIGLGTVRVAVRLNCPPEITLITLRRE